MMNEPTKSDADMTSTQRCVVYQIASTIGICRTAATMAMLVVLVIGSHGWADGIVAVDTTLPPPGKYVSPLEFHTYSALGIVLDDPAHFDFADITIDLDGSDEIENFESTFTATEIGLGVGPVALTGPVTVRTTGIAGSPTRTGTFDTEIVAMSLSGDVNFPTFGPVSVQVQIDPLRPLIRSDDDYRRWQRAISNRKFL